jgi:hypothetical protein
MTLSNACAGRLHQREIRSVHLRCLHVAGAFYLFLSAWEKKLNKAELSPAHRAILQPVSW